MSPETNGNDPPSWAALGNGNGNSQPWGSANSNANGSAKGSNDRSNPPPPAKPPAGSSLYGRLQEGMGFADPEGRGAHTCSCSPAGDQRARTCVLQQPRRPKGVALAGRADRSVRLLRAEKTPMSAAEAAQVAQSVGDDVLGYGPIERLLNDPTISEIMVNGATRFTSSAMARSCLPRFPFSTRRTCATSRVALWRRWDARSNAVLPHGRRPLNGRFPRQCHLPATGGRRAVPHYP